MFVCRYKIMKINLEGEHEVPICVKNIPVCLVNIDGSVIFLSQKVSTF